jgi:hypothetical protein
LHLPGAEALDVEEGLDHAGEAFRFAVDLGGELLLLFLGEFVAAHEFA